MKIKRFVRYLVKDDAWNKFSMQNQPKNELY